MDQSLLDAFWRQLDNEDFSTQVELIHTNSTQTVPKDMSCLELLELAKDKAITRQDFELAGKIRDAISSMGNDDELKVRF
tara:strand:- start:24023 stop:24262 length:240 start_codon:yes stop_codon:yes gene_type:complete